MSAVWLRLRSEFRRRWRAWIGLAMIVGFTAGAAMALAQAARRSERAYRIFSDHEAAADVVMTGASTFGLVGAVDLNRVERSGFVERGARTFVGLPFSGRTDDGKQLDATSVFPLASEDERLGTTIERWKMLAGRRANPADEHEAVASFLLAERLGLHVGSTLDIHFYSADKWPATEAALALGFAKRIAQRDRGVRAVPDYANGPRVRFTVVGIEASPAEFPPLLTDLAPVLHLTPAFARRYEAQIVGSPVAFFKLKPGRDLKSFQLAVERLAAGHPVSFISTRSNQAPKVQRSIHAEAVMLAVLAAAVALAGLVGVGQAMTRQTLAESEQFSTLRSLGMRDRQLRVVTVLRLLAIGVLGAALAAVIAIFLSQYALLPLARKAELHAGPHADRTVLLAGIAMIVGLSTVIALWSTRVALRAQPSRTESPRRRSTGIEGGLGVFGVPTTLGIRYALHRARQAMPAWVTMAAVGLTIAVLAGTVTFTTNLRRLLDEPHRYGWNWDVRVGGPGLPDLDSFVQPTLVRDKDIAALSGGTVTQIDLGKERIDVVAIDRIRGDALPTMLAGRAPTKPNEIALGGQTMRVLNVHIGDTVDARIGTRSRILRVVGRPVFPEFGDAGQLGRGSLMTFAGVRTLLPTAPDNAFLIRFGAHASTDEGARLASAMEPVPTHFQGRPDDLVHLSRNGGLLAVLAVFLAVLVFALIAHALVTSVRSRRSELAVLRSLGLGRRQVGTIVLWQALTLAVGALVVGLVVGAAAGQWAWRVFAHNQGVATDAIVPAAGFAVIAAGSIGLAMLAAVFPAWIAARSHPTRTLRVE